MSSEPFRQARWIWSGEPVTDAWWMFRTDLELPAGCREASLRITAAYQYILYVNGTLVTRGPALAFDFRKAFDRVDLTALVRPGGLNTLAILAPQSADPGRRGVLAELEWTDLDGIRHAAGTGSGWKVRRHDGFLAGTAGLAQGRSLLLGREEWYDARREATGWQTPGFADAGWEAARELGPATMAPWTRLVESGIGLQSDDPLLPRRIAAIELARLRTGYRVRLTAPPNQKDAIKLYVTEVTCAQPATIVVRTANAGFGPPEAFIDGRAVGGGAVVLAAGRHLLCVCQHGYHTYESELLLETTAGLACSADALLGGRTTAWAVATFAAGTVNFPWHETPQTIADPVQLLELLRAASAAAIPPELLAGFAPCTPRPGSVAFDVACQEIRPVRGGCCDRLLAAGRSLLPEDPGLTAPVLQPGNLLHGHPDAASVRPVPGHDVHLIVDFDRETIGHVELSLDAPAGTIVDVQCFELIRPDGIAWMPHNGFRYLCRDGHQTFISHIRRGFRYLSITLRGFEREVRIDRLRCRHTAFPVDEIGSFACSDRRLDQAYRMSLDTAAVCMLDTYVDCPGHEQTFWVGDARITALINQVNFGAYDLDQRSIRLVGQSLSPESADPRCSSGRSLPMAAFPDYPAGGLPMWPLLWVVQCWDHWMHGGDRDDLRENYGHVAELLRRCEQLTNPRGLLDIPGAWNLIEWAANDLSPYGEVTANNLLLVHGLRLAGRMAEALGLQPEAQAHAEGARTRMDAINRLCWDDARQAYVDTVRDAWAYQRYAELCADRTWPQLPWEAYRGCQRISEQTNTLAVLCDVVPPERLEAIRPLLRRVGEGRFHTSSPAGRSLGPPSEQEAPDGIVAVGSPFFLFFSLDALFKIGEAGLALAVMRREWGRMADLGLRTCAECFGWPRSTAHAWSAAPAAHLPLHVLGIRPLEPGFAAFTVDPCASDLEWASGSVATPHGPIHVRWRRGRDGALDIDCTAPAACRRV